MALGAPAGCVPALGGQPRLGCLEMPASDVLPFSFGRSFSYRWGSSPCDTMATVSGACCLGCVEMSLSYRRGTGLCDALALVFGACRPGCLERQLWYRRGSSPPDTMALFRCLQPWLSGDVVVASSLGNAGPSPNGEGSPHSVCTRGAQREFTRGQSARQYIEFVGIRR